MLADQGWQSIFEMPQIAVVMGCLIPISLIVVGIWSKAQIVRSEHDLKKRLIERGLSVDEIERIMAAGHEERDRVKDGY